MSSERAIIPTVSVYPTIDWLAIEPREAGKLEAVINRYQKPLGKYAEEHQTNLTQLFYIRQALATAVYLRDIEHRYGPDIAFGAAIIIGDANQRHAAIENTPPYQTLRENDPEIFDCATRDRIKQTAGWLTHQQFSKRGSLRHFFRPVTIPVSSEEEYEKLLRGVVQEWQKS